MTSAAADRLQGRALSARYIAREVGALAALHQVPARGARFAARQADRLERLALAAQRLVIHTGGAL